MFKIITFCVTLVVANAGILEPSLRYAEPALYHAPAPVVSYVSPAITKTDYIPGSYSSSYRSDVITPRVKYTETPAVSVSVPQPAIRIQPVVARVEHVAPVAPIIPAVQRIEHIAPVAPIVPALTKVEHVAPVVQPLPAVARYEHVAAAPLLTARTATLPEVARYEHIAQAPLLTAHTAALPAVARYEHVAPAPLLTGHAAVLPSIARYEHIAQAPLLTGHAATLSLNAPSLLARTDLLGLGFGLSAHAGLAAPLSIARTW